MNENQVTFSRDVAGEFLEGILYFLGINGNVGGGVDFFYKKRKGSP